MISLTLLIILTSCSMPELPKIERCIVDLKYSRCLCHDYEITKKRAGRTSDTVVHNLEYCERMVGFTPEHYGFFRMWLGDLLRWADRVAKKAQ